MMPTRQGSFRLFRLFGITVFLHWSWILLVAYLSQFQGKGQAYGSYIWFWSGLQLVFLFLIVLLHEFGHALACRSVGGQADHIVLWPLGGVAYVAPPPRPGAVLWSIVAGPLVNVVLIPVLTTLKLMGDSANWSQSSPNLYQFILAIWDGNFIMLIFNLLPIYPLDGGKILWALLWFVFGRARGLMIATVIGVMAVLGIVTLILLVVARHGIQHDLQSDIWLCIIVAFILFNCWKGWGEARAMARFDKAPRREGFACPACRAKPLLGELWRCGQCGKPFDTFATHAACPHCGTQYSTTGCLECGSLRPFNEWIIPSPVPPHYN